MLELQAFITTLLYFISGKQLSKYLRGFLGFLEVLWFNVMVKWDGSAYVSMCNDVWTIDERSVHESSQDPLWLCTGVL